MSASSQTTNVSPPSAAEQPLRLPVDQRPCTPEHAPRWRYRPGIGQVMCERC